MNYNPVDFFGTTAYYQSAPAGEKGNDIIIGTDGRSTKGGAYYIVKGLIKSAVKGTDKALTDRIAGWLSNEHRDADTLTGACIVSVTYIEDTELFYIPEGFTSEGMTTLTSLKISADQTATLIANGHYYLVKGTLDTDNHQYVGPCAIPLSSKDQSVITTNDCYLLVLS